MEQRITQPALKASGLHRCFRQGPREIHVLRGAELEIWPGETVALVGPSGAGKSTLLQILGLLERPDSGSVSIGGQECADLDDLSRTRVRRTEVGFVYQFHHLLVEFSALENVVLPQRIAGLDRAEAERRARDLLKIFGLAERADHRPAELSGGEQQRVAIARAIAKQPEAASGRRADRQPRPADGRARVPAASAVRPQGRAGRRHRHAQPGAGRAYGPGRAA